ncbi:tryptophan-rich sensory protein [Sporosarcina oncorhynchi]|uniref:Tryptophan-rich sensory protein n=1 Tax=Sporosarcina oncorhynchi TaxID=3056444 RepID=A0ABZ0L387_9BACL|nr:tryptophan-rich sensory protein [Sporosarcina sp. T2O-4]WOV86639.1 tryptophan-rich sensory protein [Sporosarcina sp. T2O-4]
MSRIILMTLSLIAVIVLYIAAFFFEVNEQTTLEIAKRLPVPFIPADYVFFIWPVIFISLFIWIVNFNKRTKMMGTRNLNRITSLFIFSCTLSIIGIFFWHFEKYIWTIIVEVLLLIILFACYFTFPKRLNELSGRIPFSLLIGWVSFTLVSTTSYCLMFHEWSGLGLSDPSWTVLYMTVCTAFALHFMYHYRDYVLNLVFVWAFIGIAVKNGLNELFITAVACFLAVLIVACIFFFRKKGIEK